jgi:hypothetical protein
VNKLIAAAAVLVALTGTAFAEGSSLTSKELFGACSTPEPKRPAELGNKPTREQITERAIAWMGYHKTMRDVQSCRYYILGIADGITTFSDLYGVTDCASRRAQGWAT